MGMSERSGRISKQDMRRVGSTLNEIPSSGAMPEFSEAPEHRDEGVQEALTVVSQDEIQTGLGLVVKSNIMFKGTSRTVYSLFGETGSTFLDNVKRIEAATRLAQKPNVIENLKEEGKTPEEVIESESDDFLETLRDGRYPFVESALFPLIEQRAMAKAYEQAGGLAPATSREVSGGEAGSVAQKVQLDNSNDEVFTSNGEVVRVPEIQKRNEETGQIEWGPTVPEAHRRFVETGLFDAIPQHNFQEGDKVVSRFTANNFLVEKVEGDQIEIVIGYDANGQPRRKTFTKDDLRDFERYIRRVAPLVDPNLEIVRVDESGRVHSRKHFPLDPNASRVPFPGNPHNN